MVFNARLCRPFIKRISNSREQSLFRNSQLGVQISFSMPKSSWQHMDTQIGHNNIQKDAGCRLCFWSSLKQCISIYLLNNEKDILIISYRISTAWAYGTNIQLHQIIFMTCWKHNQHLFILVWSKSSEIL